MRSVSKVTFGGMITAVSVVILALSSVIPSIDVTTALVAGVLLVLIIDFFGQKWAWMVFIAVSALSLMLLPNKGGALGYAMLFGPYIILKSSLEQIRRVVLEWIVKILLMNFMMTVYYIIMYCLGLVIMERPLLMLGTFLLGNLCFILFDVAGTKIITIYRLRYEPKIRKWLM